MSLARELGAAGALTLGRAALLADRPAPERVQGLAWLPLGGALVGAIAAVAASAAEAIGSAPGAALLGAAVLTLAQGRPQRPWLRIVTAGAQVVALLAMFPAARSMALVVAPMLGRWACVVQCYGGVPRPGATGLAALVGRARFREFGIASVTALGTSLVLLDAVGLAVAAASALLTMTVRLIAYRRGGLDDHALHATSALVETTALVLLGMIGSLLGGR